jgi:hypothetical protein
VIARDEDGAIAGVRDCNVSVDARARVVVVFLSHVLVLPPYRRSGLGGVLRHLPVTLGRRAVASLPDSAGDLLMAAEMEPWVAGASDTVTRLVAYGRAGYKIVDPQRLPYLQADYRAHDAIDADRLRPVPLLAVVRWVGHEGAREIPRALAAAYVEHLYGFLASHCRAADLERLRRPTLAALGDAEVPVPLLDAPRPVVNGVDDAALAPLARERVLAYYPPSLLLAPEERRSRR